MENGTTGLYDGTFEGFLTAAAWALAHPEATPVLCKAGAEEPNLFVAPTVLPTDRELAQYYWEWLGQKGVAHQRLVYFAFLAEKSGREAILLHYLRALLYPETHGGGPIPKSIQDPLMRLARETAAEKEKVLSRLFFTGASEQPARCEIRPDCDVLPLLSKALRQQFGARAWVLYDQKRKYGLSGNPDGVSLFSNRKASDPPTAFYGSALPEGLQATAAWGQVRRAV
ncbi:DUF4130 domain-containing protein [Robiginitalea sp. M366]|uniref:DUF4130 domain-containing protein n=1 Tax=Robiginitalea aestuariiviva TaxID=3036903 RepID=UPI00240D15BD|nr:DUF4130 domain-containing protein [Robiginitalea aestuariiviva]MDG1572864.1 DUF4130 domain-containing protein [Robiginitalea aestuariiviva]